jgi:hypothetical protein
MVEVCVRHDNRPGGTCSDGGEVADSTAGLPPAECEGEACGPEDCAPDPDDLAPPECAGDTPPAAVTVGVARAGDLLGRAALADGRRARRLGHRAAQQLRKAAASAAHAAHRDRLSDDCAEEIERQLEAAELRHVQRGLSARRPST